MLTAANIKTIFVQIKDYRKIYGLLLNIPQPEYL